jgi:O-antigen ligase
VVPNAVKVETQGAELSTGWRDNVDFFVLIGVTVLVAPFFGSSLTIDPVLAPRFLLWGITSLALCISLVLQLYRTPERIDWSIARRAIFAAFLGYLLFSAISLSRAVNITEGVYEVLKTFLSVAYLFIAAVILGRNRNYIPTLAKAVTATATVLCVIGIYQYLQYGACDYYCGTMANTNQFSSALFLTLPLCIYGVLTFRGYWKALSIIPTVLVLVNILLLETRSVWAGLFVSGAGTTVVVIILFERLIVSKQKRSLLTKGMIPVTGVLFAAVLIFGCLYGRSNHSGGLVEHIRSMYSVRHGLNRERVLMWKQSLEISKDNLVFGAGAGNWRIVLPSRGVDKLSKRSFKRDHFQRPHNDYIWVLFETGILGLGFYLSTFVIVLFYIFRIAMHQDNVDDKLLAICVFFGVVGYMVISFFSFPKERIFHSMFLLLLIALMVSVYHQRFGATKTISRSTMMILAGPSLLLLFLAVLNGYVRFNAEVHTKRALAARGAGNWLAVISEIDKGYSVFATLDPTSAPLQWYRGEANFLLNNRSEALEDFKRAYRVHPYHIHVLNNLATCHELAGNHREAIKYYNKALEIHPQFEEALINLGAAYYNAGRYEEAHETLLRCVRKRRNLKLQKYLRAVEKKLDKKDSL